MCLVFLLLVKKTGKKCRKKTIGNFNAMFPFYTFGDFWEKYTFTVKKKKKRQENMKQNKILHKKIGMQKVVKKILSLSG